MLYEDFILEYLNRVDKSMDFCAYLNFLRFRWNVNPFYYYILRVRILHATKVTILNTSRKTAALQRFVKIRFQQ